MNKYGINKQTGSIALFVLVSILFFLVIVTTAAVSSRNKVTQIDSEYQKIKASYEKDLNNQDNIYYEEQEIGCKLELKKIEDKKIKLILTSTKIWDEEYNYKIYVQDGENETLRVAKTGSTTDNRIETSTINTFFDVGIKDSYAEIEYKGRTTESNHCTFKDMNINSATELRSLATKVNGGKNYEGEAIKQIADIDLNGSNSNQWTPIGIESNDDTKKFKGIYDGNEFTIRGLYINNSNNGQGIFGYNIGTIKGVKTDNSYLESSDGSLGTICGYNDAGTIENCVVENATVKCTGTDAVNIGGVVGVNTNSGKIKNCNFSGSVTSSGERTGGITGISFTNSSVENCNNSGNITSQKRDLGGIVGENEASSIIKNSSNSGKITGTDIRTGGIAGYNYNNSKIQNSHNNGKIDGNDYIGGIAGVSTGNATIENSYNTGKLDSNSNVFNEDHTTYFSRVGGICGGLYTSSTISKSYNTGELGGNGIQIAGICGVASNSTVEQCYNNGEISTDNYQNGGICGYINTNAIIKQCFNFANISGKATVGGIVGICGYSNTGYVENCYNLGEISAIHASEGTAGGITGKLDFGEIKNCYNLGNISCPTQKKGSIAYVDYDKTSEQNLPKSVKNCFYLNTLNLGGINMEQIENQAEEKTEIEFKSTSFIDLINNGNASSVWKQDTTNVNNGYPIFTWQ